MGELDRFGLEVFTSPLAHLYRGEMRSLPYKINLVEEFDRLIDEAANASVQSSELDNFRGWLEDLQCWVPQYDPWEE